MAVAFLPCGRPPHLQLRPSRVSGATTKVSLEAEIPPAAARRKRHPAGRAGFSLGLTLVAPGQVFAISKGFSPRPLSVLKMWSEKLERRLLEIAAKEQDADEFIIGLEKSRDGKETPESNNKFREIFIPVQQLGVCVPKSKHEAHFNFA